MSAQRPPPGRWKRIGEALAAARSVVLNGMFILLVAAILLFTVNELRREAVVIDVIRLPQPLRDLGYSEDVVAYRLKDAVLRIRGTSRTAVLQSGINDDPKLAAITFLPVSERVDFEAPGAGVSLQSLIRMMRGFLSLDETRIAGEFVCGTPDCEPGRLALRLRLFRGGVMEVLPLDPLGDAPQEEADGRILEDGFDRYFHKAGLELLRKLDPYAVASHLYDSDREAAKREALKLIGRSNPQRAQALNLLGRIAAATEDYEGAIDWYRQAVAADPEDAFAAAYANWGDALYYSGQPVPAAEKYARAIAIDPDYLAAYNNWGLVFLNDKEYEDAAEKFERALQLDPANAVVQNNLGEALRRGGKPQAALDIYARAIELDPDYSSPHCNKALALQDRAQIPEAALAFERCLELEPAHWDIKWVRDVAGELGVDDPAQ